MEMHWIICIILSKHVVNTQYGVYNVDIINKPTEQSSVYNEYTSDKAVDGNTDSHFDGGSCTHTIREPNAWWSVDLEVLVTIVSVTIVNRDSCCEERLDKFKLYGSNRTFNPHYDPYRKTCFSFDGVFGKGQMTFTCSPPMTARFLSVVIAEEEILTLCEVEIQAVCPDGTYGHQCGHKCSSNCRTPPCDKFTADGTCPNRECIIGYKGDSCSEVCPDDTYGNKCEHKCSSNCKTPPCDKFTADGACPNKECIIGYKGDNCSQVVECPYNTFGSACQPCSMNCEFLPCDGETGGCDQCVPGYTGLNCTEECEPGKFGVRCLSLCFPNCLDPCDHVDGSCRGGCQLGWTGEKCGLRDTAMQGYTMIAIGTAAGLLVVLLVAAIICVLRREHSNHMIASQQDQPLTHINTVKELTPNGGETADYVKYDDVLTPINDSGPVYERLDVADMQGTVHKSKSDYQHGAITCRRQIYD